MTTSMTASIADSLEVQGDFHPEIAKFYAEKLCNYDAEAMRIIDIEKFTIPKKVLIRYQDCWDNDLTFVVSDLRQ